MEPHRDDQFVATLESLRPEPDEEFAALLDERAAAGSRAASAAPRRGRASSRVCAPSSRAAWSSPAAASRSHGAGRRDRVVISSGRGAANLLTSEHGAATSGQRTAKTRSSRRPSRKPRREESAPSAGASSSEAQRSRGAPKPNLRRSPQAAKSTRSPNPIGKTGPYAAGAKHRAVERGAEITLGTEPDEVGEAAGKVLETVHSYDGIVLDSSVSGGSEGEARARFTLLIPSAKLADALAAFSGIAEVRSRHESSNDITAPTVTTGELLQDSHARVQSLLNQLAGAETEAEQEAVEAKLRAERRQQARLKSQLAALHRRANLSRVSLKIVSDEAPASGGGGGGGWDAGSALRDAGQILSVAAGVVIVALAVLAPLALLALLAWLAHRVWLRGRRERALG